MIVYGKLISGKPIAANIGAMLTCSNVVNIEAKMAYSHEVKLCLKNSASIKPNIK